jgi:spore maturation protein CgeB
MRIAFGTDERTPLTDAVCEELAARGHDVVFFERDVPYYAAHRDLWHLDRGQLHLYPSWNDVRDLADRELSDADAAIVTSFCADAIAAEAAVMESRVPRRAFYDLDTPVTLEQWSRTQAVPYIGPRGLADYDVVFSYTGGASLDALCSEFGARHVVPLYGSVDPEAHVPVEATPLFRADLSYLGTYAADRQRAVESLFVQPARAMPARRFVLGGSQYPPDFPWSANIFYMWHVAPDWHSAFYCSSRLTLNVTRAAMATTGYCPSGRLFEAAACGAPLLSDAWPGLDQFFEPGREILVADTPGDVVAAIQLPDAELRAMARRARDRTIAEHTAASRADQLVATLESPPAARRPAPPRIDRSEKGEHRVGDYSGRRSGDAHSTAGVFEGIAAGRQPF